jgi:hypothetical protein
MQIMPYLKENPKEGLCPYCMNGVLAYDTISKQLYCTSCNYAVKVTVCDYTDKNGMILTEIPTDIARINNTHK